MTGGEQLIGVLQFPHGVVLFSFIVMVILHWEKKLLLLFFCFLFFTFFFIFFVFYLFFIFIKKERCYTRVANIDCLKTKSQLIILTRVATRPKYNLKHHSHNLISQTQMTLLLQTKQITYVIRNKTDTNIKCQGYINKFMKSS